jgi:NTP pyrophosphatase (non-canonical NTP hydrolase)
MDHDYLDSLRVAYEQYYGAYDAAPVLTIDANDVDFVQSAEDRDVIFHRIRGALGQGPRQPALPGLSQEPVAAVATLVGEPLALDQTARRLGDFQRFHRQLDRDRQFPADPYFNFILLQEEIGNLAGAFARRWAAGSTGRADPLSPSVREELADVLACVLKLANHAGIDLEEAYLDQMRANLGRERPDLETEGKNA